MPGVGYGFHLEEDKKNFRCQTDRIDEWDVEKICLVYWSYHLSISLLFSSLKEDREKFRYKTDR